MCPMEVHKEKTAGQSWWFNPNPYHNSQSHSCHTLISGEFCCSGCRDDTGKHGVFCHQIMADESEVGQLAASGAWKGCAPTLALTPFVTRSVRLTWLSTKGDPIQASLMGFLLDPNGQRQAPRYNPKPLPARPKQEGENKANDADNEPLLLPHNMKQCPACNIIIEKIGGDDNMMCGCEARAAGGNMKKALAGG